MRSVLLVSVLLASLTSFGQISNNPDDYNVKKYRALWEQSKTQLNQAQSVLNQTEQALQRARQRVKEAKTTLRDLENRLARNQEAIQTKRARIQQIRQNMQSAKTEIPKLENEITNLQNQVTTTQSNIENLKSRYQTLDQKAKELEAKSQQSTQRANQLQSQANQKKKQYDTLTARLTQIKQDLANAKKRVGNLKTRIDNLKSQVEDLNKKKSKVEERIPNLENQVQVKRKKFNQAKKRVAGLKARYEKAKKNGNKKKAEKLKKQLDQAVLARNQIKADLQQTQTRLANAKKRLENLKAQLDQTRTKLATAKQNLASAEQTAENKKKAIETLKPKVAQAESDYQDLQNKANRAKQRASKQLAESRAARKDADQVKSRLQAARNRLKNLQNQLVQKRSRLKELKNLVATGQSQIQSLRAEIQNHQNKVAQLQNQIANQKNVVTQRQNALIQVQNQVAQARETRDQWAQRTKVRRKRFETVKANLEYGIQFASDAGEKEGREDGRKAGRKKGRRLGSRDGKDVGERDGRERGTEIGRTRAWEQGEREGTDQGSRDGTRDGRREGDALARKEGPEHGHRDGLQAGYDDGYNQGWEVSYPKGEEAGHKLGGYEKGYAEGWETGVAKARSQALQVGSREGKLKADREFHDVELTKILLPNDVSEEEEEEADTLSANFFFSDWKYEPDQYFAQHERMQRAYLKSYHQWFDYAASRAYDRSYERHYNEEYQAAFTYWRDYYASLPYDADRKAGYDNAYPGAYQSAYDSGFKSAYDLIYQDLYDASYKKALPIRFDEGYSNGSTEGYEKGKSDAYAADLAQGRKTGDQEGFNQNYPTFLAQETERAYKARVEFYENNDVLELESALLVDANRDGVFAPGEKAEVQLLVKNFGLKEQDETVQIELVDLSENLSTDLPETKLVQIPGQTEATVVQVSNLQISPDVKVGSKESVTVRVTQGGKLLGALVQELTVSYPYVVEEIRVAKTVVVGEANDVELIVRNVSEKASDENAVVTLVSTDGKAENVTPDAVDVGVIPAGSVAKAKFSFVISEENAFEDLAFRADVFEKDWLLGTRGFLVKSSTKWSYDPNAAGLVVVSNKEAARTAARTLRKKGLVYDLWDTTFEGALENKVLSMYAGKTLVIPSVQGGTPASTITAIENFILNGGRLIAGVYGMSGEYTELGRKVVNLAHKLPAVTVGDIWVHRKNELLSETQPEYTVTLVSDSRVEGFEKFGVNLMRFHHIKHTVDEKVTAFSSAVQGSNAILTQVTREALLYELRKEMIDDRGAGYKRYTRSGGKRYRGSKLYRFAKLTLQTTGVARRALLMMWPDISKEVENGKSSQRRNIKNYAIDDYIERYKKEI